MFNVGLGEVLVIALVALLIFGPNRLPEIMRNLGKALRSFQIESQKAADVLKQGLEEPPKPPGPGVVDRPDVPDATPRTEESRPVAEEPAMPPAARQLEDT